MELNTELKAEISDNIDLLEKVLGHLAEGKHILAQMKHVLDVETAKINTMTKKEWEDLGITNLDGRKAYVHMNPELQSLKSKINKQEKLVRLDEGNAEVIKRKINFFMLLLEKEDSCNCDCHAKEEVCG